jgi:secreted PhoX family phosphatase
MDLHDILMRTWTRRAFIRAGLYGAGMVGVGLWGCRDVPGQPAVMPHGADAFGPLQSADANGLRLPPGFSSRVVAVAGQPVGTTGHVWHAYPDGGAVFPVADGGWIYASNSEVGSGGGGVGALRFAPDGTVVDAYSILTGTTSNCAGGPTPEGHWLSCEEIAGGHVWECDPHAAGSQGVARPALGIFKHEAVAVDPVRMQLYLTEDQRDGLFYRFTPSRYPRLDQGVLEVAEVVGGSPTHTGDVRALKWHPVLDATPAQGGVQRASHPTARERATRYQVTAATSFAGGEGCWFAAGTCFFTTKGDDRVWALDCAAQSIEILYDRRTASTPELTGVDNVLATEAGDVYVAEDGGNMQLVALTVAGAVKPVVEVVDQAFSEVAGPALSPDGRRLYFSSQRGPTPQGKLGITYEVSGPFVS